MILTGAIEAYLSIDKNPTKDVVFIVLFETRKKPEIEKLDFKWDVVENADNQIQIIHESENFYQIQITSDALTEKLNIHSVQIQKFNYPNIKQFEISQTKLLFEFIFQDQSTVYLKGFYRINLDKL